MVSHLIPVEVDTTSTIGIVTSVLLHGRTLPAAERGKVTEGLTAIIVSIPERITAATSVAGAHDRVPLRGRGVYANGLAKALQLTDHLLEELLVAALAAAPVLGTFDIEPGGAPLGVVALQVVNSALDLASGVPALVAGEKVHIDVLHATIPSIVDGVRGVRIRTSVAAKRTDDAKRVATLGKALPVGDKAGTAHVNTLSGGDDSGAHARSDEQSDETNDFVGHCC
mmetsp:Transcript_4057/g.9988  ORF Transcript_4057/g.9988 Transcript_4057/m.9988 type:complete len:226 (+) Transcript_4057:51-728(+)